MMWPYLMREFPVAPVEALRSELRLRGASLSPTEEHQRDVIPPVGPSARYLPAHLVADQHAAERYTIDEESCQKAGTAVDTLREILVGICHLQNTLWPDIKADPPSNGRHNASPLEDVSNYQHTAAPSPAAACRKSHRHRLPSSGTLEVYGTNDTRETGAYRVGGDATECPQGCGEHVRISDLGPHQTSLCPMR